MKKEPLVSVIMPNYNGEKYLKEAIESILNQTYTNFEFIIVDDASTDNSWKIIQEYAKKDKRIKGFRNKKNSGVTVTLNNGLKKSTGEYIARMDSDDISLPKRFEEEVKLLNNNYDLTGTNILFMNEKGKIIGKRKYASNIDKIIKIESPLAHPTVMFKKDMLKKTGTYRPEFNSAEDYDLWIRFYQKRAKIKIINKNLLKYRQHGNTVKNLHTKKTIRTTIKVKKNAKKEGFKLGFIGELRLIAEKIALIIPRRIILTIFYIIKGKK